VDSTCAPQQEKGAGERRADAAQTGPARMAYNEVSTQAGGTMNTSDPAAVPDDESEYDKWFRAEVEAGLREADDPNTEWFPHEVIQAEMAQERIWLEALIAAGRTSSGNLERDYEELQASRNQPDSKK
jgi:hypothetical protein